MWWCTWCIIQRLWLLHLKLLKNQKCVKQVSKTQFLLSSWCRKVEDVAIEICIQWRNESIRVSPPSKLCCVLGYCDNVISCMIVYMMLQCYSASFLATKETIGELEMINKRKLYTCFGCRVHLWHPTECGSANMYATLSTLSIFRPVDAV